jgi:hypothetical protein
MADKLEEDYYRLIIEQPEELVIKVNKAIKNGWLPAGGVSEYTSLDKRLVQALYRPAR